MNYYNEFDHDAAAWLRELIDQKLIPAGDVDERSITDVDANDLRGYTQCHFFAGIGGWSLALKSAGWPDDRPVWTGSCPCQCFSTAGKQKGFEDERDLWPVFFRLIRECRPAIVFGEQVENAIRHGWLDRVYADMEGAGYAVGAAVLGAHSVSAPHQRQRIYWGCVSVANRSSSGLEGFSRNENSWSQSGRIDSQPVRPTAEGGLPSISPWSNSRFIYCRDKKIRRVPAESILFRVADGLSSGVDGSGVESISESGGFPLTTRKEGRAMLLNGYGNAIVPQVAAEFVQAFMEVGR